ncbi:copper amine oxidase N-terminal domain-containing protein [Paenibacillus sp.]|uniref:copper amine oxidase N-terminal domain-containing protein n=1 Tax=Paenibacillus sp. TaxID=58172 RepID=UPI002D2256EB|nr:copper amine oxidase N-terminal domain-containing protein [Paenibacillus sp.]HZG54888.1 copper amine oxidase N-terminal domain-containing protein [Paenibacillus sp.]
MKKSIALLLSASLAFGTAPAALAAQTKFTLTTDVSAQTALADKYSSIVALFPSEGAVDLAAVKAAYEADFQADVKLVNEEIDALISQSLELAIAGDLSAGQAKQAIDKGLQWYFYNKITNHVRYEAIPLLEKGDKAGATAALEKGIELYASVLAPTAMKRDDYYKDTATPVMTEDTLATAVEGLRKAAADGDLLQYSIYRQMFDKTLIKVFHLATLKYAKTAPAAAEAKAKVEMTEGFFFFKPIYGSLSGGSKADADAVLEAFGSGDKTKLNEAAVKQHYAAMFNGKIGGYATRVLKDELPVEAKYAAAVEHAMEGNMFLAAMEVLIKEKLGEKVYATAVSHAEQYLQAVLKKDLAAANEHVVAYLKIVAQLDGVVFAIGSNELTVDGKTVTVDAASYVNPQTNRTLVPTRFIAEAIGAAVDYAAETQTVTIVKAGQTIELKLGSDVVVKDGVAQETKLEQTVVANAEGRSFIPLRAVAELFGNNVFYSKGEVVITE